MIHVRFKPTILRLQGRHLIHYAIAPLIKFMSEMFTCCEYTSWVENEKILSASALIYTWTFFALTPRHVFLYFLENFILLEADEISGYATFNSILLYFLIFFFINSESSWLLKVKWEKRDRLTLVTMDGSVLFKNLVSQVILSYDFMSNLAIINYMYIPKNKPVEYKKLRYHQLVMLNTCT